MTDAESFYLVLAGFYLFECLKLQPVDTSAVATPFAGPKHWKPRIELTRFMGIRKWSFLGPLLPWPGGLFAVSRTRSPKKSPSPLAIRRRLRIYRGRTVPLRALSLFIFLYFFAAIPVLYFYLKGEIAFLAAIAFGYFLMILAAIMLLRAYRILLPRSKESRIPHFIYTLFLPWHSMRCVDELALAYSRTWSYPSLLAALCDSPACKQALARLYRESKFMPRPLYSTGDLEPLLPFATIDTQEALLSPPVENDDRYCPVCHTSYQAEVEECVDCRGVTLLAASHRNGTAE